MKNKNVDIKIINIDIDIKDDLVCRYSDKKVSNDLIEFLINRIDDFNAKDNIKIVINKNKKIEVNSIQLIKDGLEKAYDNSQEETNRGNVKQLWLFCIGIILLFLASKIPDFLIWRQVLVIIAWVPIWEAVEIELFPDIIARKRRRNIKKLLKSEIIQEDI